MRASEFINEHQLDELTGYKQDPHYQKAVEIFADYRVITRDKLTAFSNYMQNQGFNVLGSGISGLAFEKSGYPWVFKIFNDDNGYLFYYNYSRQHQNNPHVPKVKGAPIKITPDTFLVRIEKLQEMSQAMYRSDLVDTITSIEWGDDLTPDKVKKLKKYPQILQILNDIINSGHSLDLNLNNLMARGNTLVITDPLLG